MGDISGAEVARGGAVPDPCQPVDEKLEPWVAAACSQCVVAAIVMAVLGCGILLSVSLVPVGVVMMWVPTLLGLLGLLGLYACFSRGCRRSWKSCWQSCGGCGVMDLEDDPFHSVKMLCCAVSSTGPVFIMGGSITTLWCMKLYAAAVTLGVSSLGLIVVVSVMDVLAVFRCVKCLAAMGRRDRKNVILADMKLCIVSATNAEIAQLLMGVGICIAVNTGITVAIWATIQSVDPLWTAGLGYVPIGLAIFLVPVIASCLVLNCLVVSACAGSFWRCLKNPGKPNREDEWKNAICSPDSDGHSRAAELGMIQTLPPHRMSIV